MIAKRLIAAAGFLLLTASGLLCADKDKLPEAEKASADRR
jgi:hypothetical protein